MSAATALIGCGRVLDAGGAALRPGGRAITEALIARAGLRPGDRVLDLGCGTGASVALLTEMGMRAIGIDADAALLAGTGALVAGRGEALPFADATFDAVIAECSLSLMHRAAALAEAARVLRPGGVLALADLYARAAGGRFATAARLKHDLAAAGLLPGAFEDRSDVLAAYVGRFIFAHGSLAALWGGCAEAAGRARLGYGLIAAVKPGRGAP